MLSLQEWGIRREIIEKLYHSIVMCICKIYKFMLKQYIPSCILVWTLLCSNWMLTDIFVSFHLSVKSTCHLHLLCFCITMLDMIPLISCITLSSIPKQIHNQSWLNHNCFPAILLFFLHQLHAISWSSVGSMDCLVPLWLTKVATLGLVL